MTMTMIMLMLVTMTMTRIMTMTMIMIMLMTMTMTMLMLMTMTIMILIFAGCHRHNILCYKERKMRLKRNEERCNRNYIKEFNNRYCLNVKTCLL